MNTLAAGPGKVHIFRHMGKLTEDQYLAALELVVLSDLSRSTGRAYRTLQAYRNRDRRITAPAARELAEYLRERSQAFTAAAERLEAAIAQEGEE